MLIESQQALYRGEHYLWPTELWNVSRQLWEPYKGKVPKEPAWGDVISAEKAEEIKEPVT